MFDYTTVAAQRVWRNIQRTSLVLNIITQVCTILYLVYITVAKIGFLSVNIALLAISCAYFLFYCITASNKKQKNLKRKVASVTRWTKRAIKLVNLCIMVYAILSTNTRSVMDWVLMGTSLGFWLLDIIIEIASIIIRSWALLLFEGVKADIAPVVNSVGRLAGLPHIEPNPQNKERALLDTLVVERKEHKKEEKKEKFKTALQKIPKFFAKNQTQRNHTPSISDESALSKDE